MAARLLGIAAALVLVSTLVAGCGARTFETLLEAHGQAGALPVTVDDHSGLVKAVAPQQPGAGGWLDSVTNPFGRQDQLIVNWTGGRCDRRATLVVEPSGNDFVVHVVTDRAEVCEDAGVLRGVTIQLSEPLDANRVRLDESA